MGFFSFSPHFCDFVLNIIFLFTVKYWLLVWGICYNHHKQNRQTTIWLIFLNYHVPFVKRGTFVLHLMVGLSDGWGSVTLSNKCCALNFFLPLGLIVTKLCSVVGCFWDSNDPFWFSGQMDHSLGQILWIFLPSVVYSISWAP